MSELECHRCKFFGLYFEENDKGPRCFKHATEEQRDLVDQLDRRAPALGLRRNRGVACAWGRAFEWPYGPNVSVPSRAALVTWAEKHRVKLARDTSKCALHWLTEGRCGPNRIGSPSCRQESSYPLWFDHVTRWNFAGHPRVLVAQPYGLSDTDRLDLERIADTAQLRTGARLRLEIGPTGWYGHGTTWVALWRGDLGGRRD